MKLKPKFVTLLLPALLLLITITTALFLHRRERSLALIEMMSPLPLIKKCLKKNEQVFLSSELLPFVPRENSSQVYSLKDAEMCLDAASFYRLNRKHHFSAVLLGTRPSSLSLVEALLYSPLWILSDISPAGYLFRPAGNSPWELPDRATLQKTYPDPSVLAEWLIGTSYALISIGHTAEAEQLLVMAEATKQHPSELLCTKASLAASQRRWNNSLELSRESLLKDHSNIAAREILIRALEECGSCEEALNEARNLVGMSSNQETLFLLARVANAANSNAEEIDALRRLIALARLNNQPLGASLTYLGQAYAKNGIRGEALRTFQEAIACPELTEEERHFLRGIMDHLMEGETSSTTLPPLQQPHITNTTVVH